MGKKESNPFGRPYNFSAPQDVSKSSNSKQTYDTTLGYNYAGENNALLQCDPTDLSYNPHVAEDAALAFSEMVHKRNPDFNKLFARNSEPVLSLMTGESREYANQSSASKHDRDGTSRREASGSKRSTDGDQDDSNKDSPSSMKQRSNIIIGDENPSGLAQNLVTVVKESDTDIDVDAQLKNMEGDEIRKERKRLSNRKSAKRSKIKKQKECEELCQKIDTLKDENSVLAQTLAELSMKYLELTNENDSIKEELVKEYGQESIADLLHMKPT
ncbi:bZIP transcription factor [Medicago truncatula]|uniref:BZIP transcription factor n=1 Tax=Medicago truncatula TaxID=3880 RepID=G7ISU2_MEDTR|nr:bZIP transcription factor [Medicago truncatula]